MNWYIAKMVFRIVCGDGNHAAQFDEQLRLIQAHNREEALQKAEIMGGREEEIFFNMNQQLVKWEFVGACELYTLHGLTDGAELYSRIEEKDNVDGYLHIIRQKTEQLRMGLGSDVLNPTWS
jgi:hypothetical protein